MGNAFHIDVLSIEWRRVIEIYEEKQELRNKEIQFFFRCSRRRHHIAVTARRMQKKFKIFIHGKKLSSQFEPKIPLNDCIIWIVTIFAVPWKGHGNDCVPIAFEPILAFVGDITVSRLSHPNSNWSNSPHARIVHFPLPHIGIGVLAARTHTIDPHAPNSQYCSSMTIHWNQSIKSG